MLASQGLESVTPQAFVNEGLLLSLLPEYSQRLIKYVLMCCSILIHLLVQVWKDSCWWRRILTESVLITQCAIILLTG